MKKIIAATALASAMAIVPATAFAGKDDAPGQKIKTACNASYGQITSLFTTSEDGFVPGQHGKGGAKAFSSDLSLGIHCG